MTACVSEAWRLTDGADRYGAERDFAAAVGAMTNFVARSSQESARVPFAAVVDRSLSDLVGWAPGRADMDAAVRSWAVDISSRLSGFLRTLDPWTLRLLMERRDMRDTINRAWPDLDRTFERDAPLRSAIIADPDRVWHVLGSWPSCAEGLRRAIRNDALRDWMDGAVEDAIRIPRDLSRDLGEAESALAAPAGAAAVDAASLARRAARLAPADRPRGEDDWRAFRALVPVFDELAGWDGFIDPVNLLVSAGRSWPERLRAVTEACGDDDLQAAMGSLGVMSTAFARQVLMPAVAVARGRAPDVGVRTWEAWGNAGRAILLNARPLLDMLQAAGRWSSGGGFGASLPEGLTPEAVLRWPAGLPDGRFHRVRVHVVRNGASLREELRRVHHRRSGLAHHEALRLLDACVRGRSRLATVRSMDEDGVSRPAALVEISLETAPFSAVRLLTSDGSPPDQDACNAMSRYMRLLREGRAPCISDPSSLSRTPPSLPSLCGYDWREPKRWHDAARAWEPFVTAELRSIEPWQLARLVGTHMRPGNPRWEVFLKIATPLQDKRHDDAPASCFAP